ncbi:MAG: hypothetical protein ACHQYP_09845 [Nitrospiria bacterium]
MNASILRKCPECRDRYSLIEMFHHLRLEHDYEEFVFFRFIDVELKLVTFNEGYKLICPASASCKEILLGSHELFDHLKTEHKKSGHAALNKIEAILKEKERSYYESRL